MSEQHNPLAQFAIKVLFPLPLEKMEGIGLGFTNSSLYMALAATLIFFFFYGAMRPKALIPGRLQSFAEMGYDMVQTLLYENAGPKGRVFFPFVFSLFFFVLTCNILGLTPYSFTVTSHIAVTLILALCVFFLVTITGFVKHGLHFFSLFLPKGTPIVMAPLMILIELFAYLAKPMSLSIRLAANMIAGHAILKVVAGFVIALGIIGGWVPFIFLVVLSAFELFVALLQAYIFAILTCVYLNDALNLH